MVKLLSTFGNHDSSVKLGPAMGEDAAAIRLGGNRYLISKTDPVTFTTHRAAELLLQVNANDLATRGAQPRYLQVAAFFPPGTTASVVKRYFTELQAEAKKMGVTITGGHTEVTSAVTRPLLVGNMLGFVPARRLISTAGAKAGDILIMAGAAGIEGSAILAEDHGRRIAQALGRAARREAQRLAIVPGTSVLRAARVAAALGAHAMHDPTEGGVGAAIHEMAYAAGLRVTVHLDRILVLKITRDICAMFGMRSTRPHQFRRIVGRHQPGARRTTGKRALTGRHRRVTDWSIRNRPRRQRPPRGQTRATTLVQTRRATAHRGRQNAGLILALRSRQF